MDFAWLIKGIVMAQGVLETIHKLDEGARAALAALLAKLEELDPDMPSEERFGVAMEALPEDTRVAVQAALDELPFGASAVGDDTEADELEPVVTYGLFKRLRGAEGRKLRRAMEGDRFLRRAASREAARRFKEEGGDVNDFQSFMEWLLAHADEIIAFVQKIIALFGI